MATPNYPASVMQLLLNTSRKQGDEFQRTLSRYALERLLYRIGISEYRDLFVLKGALLFAIWTPEIHRPTRDLDLLGFGESSPERIKMIFISLCSQILPEEGIEFLSDSIVCAHIRENQRYTSLRLTLLALLNGAKIPVQVDIGYDDAIYPPPNNVNFPVILHHPIPHVRAYPMESVIAEKFEAIVTL